jgi:hypothetical protein
MRFYRSKNPPSQTAYKVCVASVFYHTAKNKAIMTEKKPTAFRLLTASDEDCRYPVY